MTVVSIISVARTNQVSVIHRKLFGKRTIECLSQYRSCNMKDDCISGDDERFCRRDRLYFSSTSICYGSNSLNLTDVEQFLCSYTEERSKQQIVYFKLDQSKNPPKLWIRESQMKN